jgi:quercetin dioxygenase-like cupin family protein
MSFDVHYPKLTFEAKRKSVVILPDAFEDARGILQPFGPIESQSAMVIYRNKGSIGANHYHKKDWHICYLAKGSLVYYERPHGHQALPESYDVQQGEAVYTGPNVEHAMLFTEDSILVVVSGGPRSQESYEDDLVRVKLIE